MSNTSTFNKWDAEEHLKNYLSEILPIISNNNEVNFEDFKPYLGKIIADGTYEPKPEDILLAHSATEGRYWVFTMFGYGFIWISNERISRMEIEVPPISGFRFGDYGFPKSVRVEIASGGNIWRGIHSGLSPQGKTFYLLNNFTDSSNSRTLNYSRRGFL